MTWNYRLARKRFKDGHEELGIYSVYYDEAGKVQGISAEPAVVSSYSIEELRDELDLMKECLKKPVLEHSEDEIERDEHHGWLVSYAPESEPDETSAKRLFGLLIGMAIRNGAREIWLQPRSKRGGFKLFHRLQEGGDLQEQMNLHRDSSQPLRAYLAALAGEDGAFSITLQSAEHQISLIYEFSLRSKDSTYGETLILVIQPARPQRF